MNQNTNNQYQQATQSTQASGTFEWSKQFRGTMSPARIVGANLKSVEQAFTQVVENRMNEDVKLKLLALDASIYNFPLDIMIIGVEVPGKYVGYHALAIDDGKKSFGVYPGVLNGENFTVDKMACLMFTNDLLQQILKVTGEYFAKNSETGKASMCGYSILPVSSLNLEDESAVTAALLNVYGNIETVVNTQEGGQVLNVAKASKDEYLETRREHTAANAKDEYMQPIRADLQVSLTARRTNMMQNNIDASYGGIQAGTEVALSTAYVDLLPYQANPVQGFTNGPFNIQNVQAAGQNNIEIANIVFTSINPGVSQDPSNMLLALASGMDAINNQYWWATTLNPFRQPAANLHSVKGLGYDIAERFRNNNVDFKQLPIGDESFTEADWNYALNEYVAKDLSFSFDVPLSGAGNWRYRFLTEASKESQVQAADTNSASAKILRLADELTNFQFGKIYAQNGGSGQPVSRLENRFILLGNYFCSERKEQRDIRDIDRMFLLSNMVQDDVNMMEWVRRWTGAQIDPNLNVQQRLFLQREILNRIVPNANITGYGIRYDLEGAFVKSLLDALVAAEFRTSFSDVVADNYQQSMNATYIARSIAHSMAATTMQSGIFNPQTGGQNVFGAGMF